MAVEGCIREVLDASSVGALNVLRSTLRTAIATAEAQLVALQAATIAFNTLDTTLQGLVGDQLAAGTEALQQLEDLLPRDTECAFFGQGLSAVRGALDEAAQTLDEPDPDDAAAREEKRRAAVVRSELAAKERGKQQRVSDLETFLQAVEEALTRKNTDRARASRSGGTVVG